MFSSLNRKQAAQLDRIIASQDAHTAAMKSLTDAMLEVAKTNALLLGALLEAEDPDAPAPAQDEPQTTKHPRIIRNARTTGAAGAT